MPERTDEPNAVPGHADELAAFYAATLPRVYGYFLTRCGGEVATAEDLTQETYLAFVRHLRERREVASPVAWLFGIARHKLIDHYRRRGRLERLDVPWTPDELEAVAEPAWDRMADASHERVMAALARLPESQRIVVSLRYLDGCAMEEIAAALGKSLHAVESLLARARINLKRHLTEGEPSND